MSEAAQRGLDGDVGRLQRGVAKLVALNAEVALGLLLATLAGIVALRFLRRRDRRQQPQGRDGVDEDGLDFRAQELRRALEQARGGGANAGVGSPSARAPAFIELALPPEPPFAATAPGPEEIAAERQRLHERARTAVDEMRGATGPARADDA